MLLLNRNRLFEWIKSLNNRLSFSFGFYKGKRWKLRKSTISFNKETEKYDMILVFQIVIKSKWEEYVLLVSDSDLREMNNVRYYIHKYIDDNFK